MPVSSSMRLTLALVSLALAAVPARLLAQAQATTGVIRGTVTDSAGAPLAGASVTLRNAETNAERVLTTNDHGVYVGTLLRVGTYEVAARALGFLEEKKTGLGLRLGETLDVPFALKPQAVQLQEITVAAEEREGDVGVGPGRLQQAEAVGAGAEDGGQVGVVGLVVRVGGLAVLLGREGMHQPRLEAGLAEGALHGAVVLAGALDEDDQVAQVMLLHGLTEAVDGGLEVAAGVGQRGRRAQHLAVEVGEQPLGAGLGAVDGDDAEVLRPDLLHAGDQLAVGLQQLEGLAGLRRPRGRGTRHGKLLSG